jgi:LysM repeat protein
MNTPSPLIPQGSLGDQKPRNKSNVYIAVFAILLFHVVLLGALLLQGCKDRPANTADSGNPSNLPPVTFSNQPVVEATVTPPVTNVPVAPPPPVVLNTATNVEVAPAAATEHVVAKGESFYTIAKKYGLKTEEIAKANPGVDSKKLRIGQKIKVPERAAAATTAGAAGAVNGIPAPGPMTSDANTYVVKTGDNLIKIAKNHGLSVRDLKAANHLRTDRIVAGQKLKLPAKAAAPEPAPATAPTATTPATPTSASYVTPLPPVRTASLR